MNERATVADYVTFLILVGSFLLVGAYFGKSHGRNEEQLKAIDAGVGEYIVKDGKLEFSYKKCPPQPTPTPPAPAKPPGKPPGDKPGATEAMSPVFRHLPLIDYNSNRRENHA